MSDSKLFQAAFPYAESVMQLPVTNIETTVSWYSNAFGMTEVARSSHGKVGVVLERDGVQLGFVINGGDAENDGAAILVTDIHRAKVELEAKGVKIGNWRIDERDGQKFQVFFVVAPDGLCFYFHQPIAKAD